MSMYQAKLPPAVTWIDSGTWELLARAIVVLVFTVLAMSSVANAVNAAINWTDQPLDHKLLTIAARLSNALFLALVAATTVTRLRPIRKAAGVQPRIAALLGTFLLGSLALLPRAQLPAIWLAISSALVIVGSLLSFAVLRWLGKSFSIMAEARGLVTSGPYALVRHPLYICEEIAVIGALIQVMSPLALLIVLLHGAIQFQRMFNEEKVLRATFPDYPSYAARTPRLIPRLPR